MANTLTNLIPTLYQAIDVVSREMVGFIPAVARNSNSERAALDESILVPVVPAITTVNVTPGLYAPDNGDAAIGNVSMSITKSKMAPVRFNGEETVGLGNAGTYNGVVTNRFAQAFRALVNEIEADLAALHLSAGGSYGTANSTPFGSAGDLSDAAFVRKALSDRGAPQTDLQMVLGSAAIANMRGKQSVLFKTNEAGTDALLRQGILGNLEGFSIHDSGQVKKHTAGTAASSTTNAAGYAIGATTITLASAGTGSFLAGDVITFAGDTNQYVIVTGDADVSNGGTLVLQEPGLLQAIPTSATAITRLATSTRNMAFDRNAIQLVTRAPAMPEGGDMADDKTMIVDPVSGLAFEVAVYRQYRQVKYEVAIAWGVAAIAPRHIALLLG